MLALERIVAGLNDADDRRHLLSVLSFAWYRDALESGDPRELKISEILHRVDQAAATDESQRRSGFLLRDVPDDDEWLDRAARLAALTPANRLWSECRDYLRDAVPLVLREAKAMSQWDRRDQTELVAERWLSAISRPLPEHRDVLRARAPHIHFADDAVWPDVVRAKVVSELVHVREAKAARGDGNELEEADAEEIVAAGLRALGAVTRDLFQYAAVKAKRDAVK